MYRRPIAAECDVGPRRQMMRHLLTRIFGASRKMQQDARDLIILHGPEKAWRRARDKRRIAGVVDAQDARVHWDGVMREIERRSSYRHQPDRDGIEER